MSLLQSPAAHLLAALVFVCPARHDDGFAAAVRAELSARPLTAAQDIYKLAHQSLFGPGHIISSAESAREYLEKETASLGPALPGEKEIEDLGGGMVRVNLRPFRDSGGSVEDLLRAMLETSKETTGPEKAAPAMAGRLETARETLAGLGKEDMAEDLARLAAEQAEKGYPPFHHSKAYRDAYMPAYRVVALRHLSRSAGVASAHSVASPSPSPDARQGQAAK